MPKRLYEQPGTVRHGNGLEWIMGLFGCVVTSFVVSMIIIGAIQLLFAYFRQEKTGKDKDAVAPFSVAEYYKRKEKLTLQILEDKKPVSHTIVLWWGLDGLRLNEDGSREWISRKNTVNQNIFYPSQQSICTPNHPIDIRMNMCQSTQSQIDALKMQNVALQTQAEQINQNMAIISLLHQTYPYTRYICYGYPGSAAYLPQFNMYQSIPSLGSPCNVVETCALSDPIYGRDVSGRLKMD